MKQLDPKAVWLFLVSFIIRFVFFAFFLGMFLSSMIAAMMSENGEADVQFPFWMFGGAFVVYVIMIFIISYIWARLSYHYYRYELTDSGFKKESGVIYKKYVTIPYDRIQNVDINRGIWARILGLSDLQIQTAGYSAPAGRGAWAGQVEGRLPGLSREEAEKLRDELIERAKHSKHQGL